MHKLLAWINANATGLYWQNNPHSYLFARPSDGFLPSKYALVFGDVLNSLGLRHDPVTRQLPHDVLLPATTTPPRA